MSSLSTETEANGQTGSCVIIPGGGSAGLNWTTAAEMLQATVLPLPELDDVAAMASELVPAVAALPRPLTLVGASLGAMVALEIAQQVPVDALVLAAAGFGIDVGQDFLDWIGRAPSDLFPKLARVSLAPEAPADVVATAIKDWEARGSQTVHRHLSALQRYKPHSGKALTVPTYVLWGEHDKAVPLQSHVELAAQLGGVVVPIVNAGHMPFLEQPRTVVSWILKAIAETEETASDVD